MEQVFTQLIRERAAQGVTVLLSSHILSEVEKLCDRLSIIKQGRLIESGTLAELRHLHRSRLTARLGDHAADLAAIGGVHGLTQQGERWVAQVEQSGLSTVLAALADWQVTDVTITPPTLEDLFLSHYDPTVA